MGDISLWVPPRDSVMEREKERESEREREREKKEGVKGGCSQLTASFVPLLLPIFLSVSPSLSLPLLPRGDLPLATTAASSLSLLRTWSNMKPLTTTHYT